MEKLLNMTEVQEIVGFSRSHLNDLIRENEFPAPIRINTSIRWPHSLIQEWIQKQIERNANENL